MTTSLKHPDTKAHNRPHAITPSIWWIGRSGWGGLPELTYPWDCNIYLLKGDKFDVLIDCGGGAIDKLEKNIRTAGSSPSRIREIWLTHMHGDHFLGAGQWAKKYPQTICRISRISIDYFRKKNYRLIDGARPLSPGTLHVPRRLMPLQAGSVLKCAPFEFSVEETPGHVPDALSFRGKVDGSRTLVSGDTVIGDQFFGVKQKGVVGWIDGAWLSSVRDVHKSLVKLAAKSKSTDLILPGHGRPQAGKAAASSLKNCVGRIERLMANPDFFNIGPYYSLS